jgi:hypothetical protein
VAGEACSSLCSPACSFLGIRNRDMASGTVQDVGVCDTSADARFADARPIWTTGLAGPYEACTAVSGVIRKPLAFCPIYHASAWSWHVSKPLLTAQRTRSASILHSGWALQNMGIYSCPLHKQDSRQRCVRGAAAEDRADADSFS